MKKFFSLLLSAVMAASFAATASAWEENADYVKLGEITAEAYPASTATGLPEVTTGQLLTGTIFTSQDKYGVQCDGGNSADRMFDGNQNSYYDIPDRGWGGIILDQAYTLTEVRAAPTPELTTGDFFNFWLQGSNDGINWVNIIIMRQDAHGNDYHIFTPQSVTDQRYIDAGYSASKDESIHWLANGGSYRMYRVVSNTVGELELYGNPAPATEVTTETLGSFNIATPNYNPFNIIVRSNAKAISVNGSLTGTIVGGGGPWNKALYEKAFDNNGRTHFDPSLEGPECWVGMKFDEPHKLTEVHVRPKRGVYTDMENGLIQGSLDGVNWVTLVDYSVEDCPSKQEWVIKSCDNPNGYYYFRYTSDGATQAAMADILFYGEPAPAAEPYTATPLVATNYKYTGDFYFAKQKNTVVDTEISGTPICALYYYGWVGRDQGVEAAFDGNIAPDNFYTTIWRLDGPHYWIGLKADASTVVSSVKIYMDTTHVTSLSEDLFFQGSVDGVDWVTLATFVGKEETKDADGWYTKDVSDPDSYKYFRLLNPDNDHPSCYFTLNEMKIYGTYTEPLPVETEAPATTVPETDAPETNAPETAAPETAAPETAAPETNAPETAAPETAAPETAAPETAAPETAAPETAAPETSTSETDVVETNAPDTTDEPTDANNTGIIVAVAAAVVVIAIVGIVIAKKKK